MAETDLEFWLRKAAAERWYFDELQRQARAKTDKGEAYNSLEAAFVRRVGEGRLRRPRRRGPDDPPRDIKILVAFNIAYDQAMARFEQGKAPKPNEREMAAAVGPQFGIEEDGVLSAVSRARVLNVELNTFNI